MTIHALVSGTVSGPPTTRTTTAGKPWASLKLATGDQGLAGYISVSAFASEAVEALLAIPDGAPVSVQGRLEVRTWTGRDQVERQGLSLVATAVMALEAPPKRRNTAEPARKSARPPTSLPEPDPFGPGAGFLDDVLPAGANGNSPLA